MIQADPTLPLARRDDLVVEQLPGETVVYDLRSHQVHCLNPAAARAWDFCNGRHSRRELSEALQREFGLPNDDAVVDLALASLRKAALLPAQSDPVVSRGHSRRSLMLKLALAAGAAALLPAVRTAHAQVGGYLGSCAADNLCIAGVNDCSPCYIPVPAPQDALEAQCDKRRCWQGNCRPKHQTNCA
jgi:hypothetical protein